MTLNYIMTAYKEDFINTLKDCSLLTTKSYTDNQYNQLFDLITAYLDPYLDLDFLKTDETINFRNVDSKFYLYGVSLLNVIDTYLLFIDAQNLNGLELIKAVRPVSQQNNLKYESTIENRKATAQTTIYDLVSVANNEIGKFVVTIKQFLTVVY